MNEPYPPVIALPEALSDQAAAQLLEFLYELTQRFESYYAGQLHRYYQQNDPTPPAPDQDPPF
jgi:hypothetical protein